MKKIKKYIIIFIKTFQKIRKTERGKAIIYLGFYSILIFFLLLNINNPEKENNTKKVKNNQCNFSIIEQEKYNFKYTDIFDNEIILYQGNSNENELTYQKNTNNIIEDYIYKNDLLLKKDSNNNYILIEENDKLRNFKKLNNMKKILEKSTYISKIKSENNIMKYSYQISTTTVEKIINNINIDIDDLPNQITIECNKNKQITKIEYDLSSYGIYKNYTKMKLQSILEFNV